ncbi:uncharacterized protein BDZ99DRAFT_524105 [Mytilinidion resinicola]|uniref:Uncharacterized protein n=1 Tax=Mytilinidion resinicola TaxID=574789 RepID=A0A6A6YAL4_9PEZI|nr:uncharacterized protein BDZ99DRAFT_524105 [Mytilinidion resinicola]KAF2805862.1 hypothetical protein BDZ99DRAFT_524105 [Mytilinidion resinicola]
MPATAKTSDHDRAALLPITASQESIIRGTSSPVAASNCYNVLVGLEVDTIALRTFYALKDRQGGAAPSVVSTIENPVIGVSDGHQTPVNEVIKISDGKPDSNSDKDSEEDLPDADDLLKDEAATDGADKTKAQDIASVDDEETQIQDEAASSEAGPAVLHIEPIAGARTGRARVRRLAESKARAALEVNAMTQGGKAEIFASTAKDKEDKTKKNQANNSTAVVTGLTEKDTPGKLINLMLSNTSRVGTRGRTATKPSAEYTTAPSGEE